MITKKRMLLLLLLAPIFAFAADNDTTRAINKAIENIKSKGDNVRPMMVPTLDHLIKTYHIDLNVEKQKKRMIANATGNDLVFLRFFSDDLKAPQSLVQNMPGIDHTTAAALYCDCYGLPPTFFTDINDMAYSEGYGLPHALLALAIIEERKCKYDTLVFNKSKALLIPYMETLIFNQKPTSDMGVEAIVMLYISGYASKVKNEWIEAIIKAQGPNGSWDDDNEHTTVLALWALLEANRTSIKK